MVSVRKPRLQQSANQGDTRAQVALDLANSPETFLATVQMGTTLIGIFAGAFGERTLAIRIESYLNSIPRLAPYGHAIYHYRRRCHRVRLTHNGELVPKQIALRRPEQSYSQRPCEADEGTLSSGRAHCDRLEQIRQHGPACVPHPASKEPLVTEEEIKVIMEQGAEAGLIEKAEHETVRRLFRLSDRAVMALIKPRHDIVWLDADAPTEQTMKLVAASSHSRFPVARSSLDDIVGMVKEKDLLACCMSGRPLNLTDVAQPALFVPGAIPAFRLLEMFKKSRTHIALVVDEYGDVEGLVTINDFFEDLVGEVASADEPQERHAMQRPDGSWLIDGEMPVHDFKELLNLGKLPGEERGSYLTLGGFIMVQIGHIPVVNDSFEAEGVRFEVVGMEGKRVDKVLVQPLPSPGSENKEGPDPGSHS